MALAADGPIVYADSSALVKLVIEESESEALERYVESETPRLVSSRIALVEVVRAATVAHSSAEVRAEAERRVRTCTLIDVSERVLRRASGLASPTVRTLDAVHLATAEIASADWFLVYDRRLAEVAEAMALRTLAPS